MNIREAIELCPHLASPLALAHADTGGRYVTVPHLSMISREFMKTVMAGGGERTMVNTPPQHAKSSTTSEYGTAWALLVNPDIRFVLVGYSEQFADSFGARVRDIIDKWGEPHGVRLRQDSRAKGEWQIDGRRGGMVCKGPKGGVTGRPVDILLIDDLIKDHEQAMSPTVMESHWNWWKTSIFGRLRNVTSVFMIGTRWSRRDLFGRLLDQAKRTGEKWNVLKFRAIATEGDILGRKIGEALWPEQISLRKLEIAKQEYGPWFRTVFQQDPIEEGSNLFRPRRIEGECEGWPLYTDIGDAVTIRVGMQRRVIRKEEMTIIICVDLAQRIKSHNDYTAFVVLGLTQDGLLFILDVVNDRIRQEEKAPRLEKMCKQYLPHIVVSDDDMLADALVLDCRRYRCIPEIMQLPIANKNKRIRATAAIIRGENGLICLPSPQPGLPYPWLDVFCDQLSSFTGIEDEHDDMVDALGIGGRLADELKGDGRPEQEPDLLSPARDLFGAW